MLKILGIVAGVVVAALLGLLVFAASKPDSFQVTRSTVIQAPPDRVFPLIDSFAAWRRWSPWEDLDPNLQRTYSGPQAGVGAGYAWKGDSKVGSGSMTILESVPASKVKIKLDFVAPFEAHNIADFELAPVAEGTRVTWTMSGPSPFVSKVMGVFFSMDRMIGADFEKGLSRMKVVAESGRG